MRWFIRNFLNLIGVPGDLDTLASLLGISGASGIVTAYIANHLSEDAHWTIVAGFGAAAFSMMLVYYILLTRRLTSVYEQVSMDEVAIIQANLDGMRRTKKKFDVSEAKISHLTLRCTLRNHSERTIFYKLKRSHHSMSGKTPKNNVVAQNVCVIPSHGQQGFILATLPDIELSDSISGDIDLEILYGPNKDSLRYLFKYQGTPHLSVAMADDGRAQMTINTLVQNYGHERLGFFS